LVPEQPPLFAPFPLTAKGDGISIGVFVVVVVVIVLGQNAELELRPGLALNSPSRIHVSPW
jgi:hypothetical protein